MALFKSVIIILNLLKDPLFRRFLSATVFASAFVWVAVEFFDVDTEVIRVLFVYSIAFVVLLVLAALVMFPLVRLFRRKRSGLLGQVPDESED